MSLFRGKHRTSGSKDSVGRKGQRFPAGSRAQAREVSSPDPTGPGNRGCNVQSATRGAQMPARPNPKSSCQQTNGKKTDPPVVHRQRVDIHCTAQTASVSFSSMTGADAEDELYEQEKIGAFELRSHRVDFSDADVDSSESRQESGADRDRVSVFETPAVGTFDFRNLCVLVDDQHSEAGDGRASPAIIAYPGWLSRHHFVGVESQNAQKEFLVDTDFQTAIGAQTPIGLELVTTSSGLLTLASEKDDHIILPMTNQFHHKGSESIIDSEPPETSRSIVFQCQPCIRLNEIGEIEDLTVALKKSELSSSATVCPLEVSKPVSREMLMKLEEATEEATQHFNYSIDEDESYRGLLREQELDSASHLAIDKSSLKCFDGDSAKSEKQVYTCNKSKLQSLLRKNDYEHLRTFSCPYAPKPISRRRRRCDGSLEDSAAGVLDSFWPTRLHIKGDGSLKASLQRFSPAVSDTKCKILHEMYGSQPGIAHKWHPSWLPHNSGCSPTTRVPRLAKLSAAANGSTSRPFSHDSSKPKSLRSAVGRMVNFLFCSLRPRRHHDKGSSGRQCLDNTDKCQEVWSKLPSGYTRRHRFMMQMIEESRLH